MNENLIAQVQITIDATVEKVWDALVNPVAIKEYMFGAEVVADWKKGGRILWRGEWKGNPYEDKGTILKFDPLRELQYTHFSPLSGQEDIPANYHRITVRLFAEGNSTKVVLTQDQNQTEQEKEHSGQNWKMALEAMKRYVEG